ncbi:MAG: SRPBCC family protein [Bacteroidota bacterium]
MKTTIFSLALVLLCNWALGQETSKTTKHKANHRTYHSDIIIDATPAEVWSVLTDFDTYPEWSYQFKEMRGEFKDQGKVKVFFERNPDKNDK